MAKTGRDNGFQRRRDANFLLNSDPCVTAVGAPVPLARNFAGYTAALQRPRQEGRWGVWEKEETPFAVASSFLKDRDDICVPVELLTELVDEDSKLRNAARCPDLPDQVCSDLSWPGACLEHLHTGVEATHRPRDSPLLIHTAGPENGTLSLLRPRRCSPLNSPPSGDVDGGIAVDGNARWPSESVVGNDPVALTSASSTAERLMLHSGPIRQISALFTPSTTTMPPKIFARCDYSATLVGVRGEVDRLCRRSPESAAPAGREGLTRRKKHPKATASSGKDSGSDYDGAGRRDGLAEDEKLVFARRLTCVACSPYTRKNAAFLDEEFRLFNWHPERGAVMHGSGPLQFPAPILPGDRTNPDLASNEAKLRRNGNADVSLDYGNHPRVLWMAGQHRAYRVDVREPPRPAALAPALDPGVYFDFTKRSIVRAGSGGFGGRGETPRIRALTVGRRSVHEVFVAAGLQLCCMDVRFPRDVVARWDLPREVDQLRWLPGMPGEGFGAEEIILASARRSPGFYVNTWASDVPGWRGCQMRLGLDETSPAASAARRPLTFTIPATPLSEMETRSGGLFVGLPQQRGAEGEADVKDVLCFVNATSTGDVYGQRVQVRRADGKESSVGGPAIAATHRSALASDRLQSMLPCGGVCLDDDAAPSAPAGGSSRSHAPGTANTNSDASDNSPKDSANGGDAVTSREPSSEDGRGDETEDDVDCRNDWGALTQPRRASRKRGRAPRGGREGSEDADSPATRGDGAGDGDGWPGGKETYYPVNAGALRTSIEDAVPDLVMCAHRRLPSLTRLVHNPGGRRAAAGAVGLPCVEERRQEDFADLRNREDDVADFLLKPRTPEELLFFCRKTLRLDFPVDPIHGGNPPESTGAKKCLLKRKPLGGVHLETLSHSEDVLRVDDSTVAADVAEAVLAWGRPFRRIETGWRAAAAGGGYAVASRCHPEVPHVPTVLLCSAGGFLKGKPNPMLRPGKFGQPFASDVGVQDIKWLKDQWSA